jgi:hypothetical protein
MKGLPAQGPALRFLRTRPQTDAHNAENADIRGLVRRNVIDEGRYFS